MQGAKRHKESDPLSLQLPGLDRSRKEYLIISQEEIIKIADLVYESRAISSEREGLVDVGGDAKIQNHAHIGVAEGSGYSSKNRRAEDCQDTDCSGSEPWKRDRVLEVQSTV